MPEDTVGCHVFVSLKAVLNTECWDQVLFALYCMCVLNIPQKEWLIVLGFNATLTAKLISWRSVTHVFHGFLTPVLTQLFFPKPPNTFLTCFCRGKRRKYARKEVCLNERSNSQPPGYESNRPPGRGSTRNEYRKRNQRISEFSTNLEDRWLM